MLYGAGDLTYPEDGRVERLLERPTPSRALEVPRGGIRGEHSFAAAGGDKIVC